MNDTTDFPRREISLLAMGSYLSRHRVIIGPCLVVFALAATALAFVMTPKYRAEVEFSPVGSSGSFGDELGGGSLGGLAALAGITLGGASRKADESLEYLRSRQFTREFIQRHDLMPVLFANKWDTQRRRWRGDPPTIAEGVTRFSKTVRQISEDHRTGMVTLAIIWRDRIAAAQWANALVAEADAALRQRAIAEFTRSTDYLKQEGAESPVIEVQERGVQNHGDRAEGCDAGTHPRRIRVQGYRPGGRARSEGYRQPQQAVDRQPGSGPRAAGGHPARSAAGARGEAAGTLKALVEPLDYLHAVCLAGVAIYVWRREPVRLLLTPLMLVSFLVLYGAGNIIYFLGADTVSDVRHAVTLSLILMWLGVLAGAELARGCAPALARQSALVIRGWKSTPLDDHPRSDQLLAAVGVLTALTILVVFFGFGKPGQILTYLALQATDEKQKYRLEMGGQGGYVYQTLIASIAPFLSFLLLLKGTFSRQRYLVAVGALLCVAVFAGKFGTFQKIPWLIYLLQLLIVFQARKRLEFGAGRITHIPRRAAERRNRGGPDRYSGNDRGQRIRVAGVPFLRSQQ